MSSSQSNYALLFALYNDTMLSTEISTLDHLPEASVLTLDCVTWEDYEHVLECLQERPGGRVTYDCGRLDIVTTSREHEESKELILRRVQTVCEELHMELQSYGGEPGN